MWDSREQLLAQHGSDNFTHTPLNVGPTIWALLYGDGDFEKSIRLAVNGGYDTDCTAATVGATIVFALGAEAIPNHWRNPIGDGVSSALASSAFAPPPTSANSPHAPSR